MISVIVPVKNKAYVLDRAMRSIMAAVHASPGCELIVIEHGSTDGSVEILKAIGLTTEVHPLSGGTIAHARNYGARLASGDVLVFWDCDVDVPVDYMTRLEQSLRETGADVVGAPVALPDDPTWVEYTWHMLTVDARRGERHFLNSANIVFTRAAFDRVGGFPEELETGEDWEVCRRTNAMGGRIFAEPLLVAKHLDNPKTVAAFFRKERWYGRGMLGASERNRINLTTGATIGFGIALIAAAVGLTTGPRLLAGGAAGAIAGLVAATFVFRRRTTGGWAPLAAVALIPVFYAARLTGMLSEIFDRRASPRSVPA